MKLENGRFAYSSANDRIEAAVDFVISYYDVIRTYNSSFTSILLYQLIQKPQSTIFVEMDLIKLLLSSLFTRSIPFINIDLFAVEVKNKTAGLFIKYSNTEQTPAQISQSSIIRFVS